MSTKANFFFGVLMVGLALVLPFLSATAYGDAEGTPHCWDSGDCGGYCETANTFCGVSVPTGSCACDYGIVAR